MCVHLVQCTSVVGRCFAGAVLYFQTHLKQHKLMWKWKSLKREWVSLGIVVLPATKLQLGTDVWGRGAALWWLIVRVSFGRLGKITMWIKGTCLVQMKTLLMRPIIPIFGECQIFKKYIQCCIIFDYSSIHWSLLSLCEFLIMHVRWVIFTVNSNVVFLHRSVCTRFCFIVRSLYYSILLILSFNRHFFKSLVWFSPPPCNFLKRALSEQAVSFVFWSTFLMDVHSLLVASPVLKSLFKDKCVWGWLWLLGKATIS